MSSFFGPKAFFEASLYLQFGFVILWQKNIGAKATRNMLMKLTTGPERLQKCGSRRCRHDFDE